MVNVITVSSLLLPSNEDQIFNKGHVVTSRRTIVLLIMFTNFSVDLKVVGAWRMFPTAPKFGSTDTVPDVKIVTVYIPYYTVTYSGTLLRKPAAVKFNIMVKYNQVN